MKSLFYTLLAALSLVSCADVGEGETPQPKQLCFSANIVETKAGTTLKESWTVGEQVAIYKSTGELKCYKIVDAATGALALDGSVNHPKPFYVDEAGSTATYTAYYPYKGGRIEDYVVTGTPTEDRLVTEAITPTDNVVGFAFEHIYSHVTFLITSYGGASFSALSLSGTFDWNGDNTAHINCVTTDDWSTMTASLFVLPVDLTSAMLTLTVDGKEYFFDLTESTKITKYEAGVNNIYKLTVGTSLP